MGTSLGQLFVTGGWVMWPLVIFSILTWAVVFERAYIFMTFRPRMKKLMDSVTESLREGNTAGVKALCKQEKPVLAEAFMAVIEGRTKEHAERIVERSKAKLSGYLKKNLWILGTIGSASPFVGLLGTVIGIVRAFHDMSEKGAGGFDVVAGGISEALIATAAGLVVAILALLTYNIYVTAANATLVNLRITLDELIDASFLPTPSRRSGNGA